MFIFLYSLHKKLFCIFQYRLYIGFFYTRIACLHCIIFHINWSYYEKDLEQVPSNKIELLMILNFVNSNLNITIGLCNSRVSGDEYRISIFIKYGDSLGLVFLWRTNCFKVWISFLCRLLEKVCVMVTIDDVQYCAVD